MDHKKSVQNAIHKFHEKQLNVARSPRRKNKNPERDVQHDVMAWGRENDVFLHVIESSTWNGRNNSFGDQKAEPGFPDVLGNTLQGHSVYIELKAKDRRSTLREIQRVFLIKKIEQSCFAVVVDSRNRLEQYWKQYWTLRTESERKAYLLDCLPKKRPSKRRGNVTEDLGF